MCVWRDRERDREEKQKETRRDKRRNREEEKREIEREKREIKQAVSHLKGSLSPPPPFFFLFSSHIANRSYLHSLFIFFFFFIIIIVSLISLFLSRIYSFCFVVSLSSNQRLWHVHTRKERRNDLSCVFLFSFALFRFSHSIRCRECVSSCLSSLFCFYSSFFFIIIIIFSLFFAISTRGTEKWKRVVGSRRRKEGT